MADVITRLRLETEEFHNRARRVTTDVQDMSHQLEVVGNRLMTTDPKMLKLSASFGKMQTVSTTLKGKISELESEFVAWSHLYNQLTDQQKRDPFGRNIVRGLDELRSRINQTKTELQSINSQLTGAGGSGFGSKFMQGLVPGIGMGAGAAAAMAALKAVGMLKEAVIDGVKTNMEFEQSNANLAAVLGKTRNEIVALTQNAKDLGGTTVYTAGQVSELQTVLARRGFGEDQILQMTHGITNLAVATGTDLAQSAELASSTMQAFGMNATEMERIVSVLGVSTTKSALTTEKLGTALQYVAPTARAAGYSLEDTVAMLGKLVDSGFEASVAGTSLRQIILSMSTENGKLAKSFGRPVRGLEDFVAALNHVSNAEDILSDASKEVRVTAVPALISLANNKDKITELRDAITGVNGELQKMADEQINTLRGSITLMTSAWDGFMLSMNNSNGILKSVVDNLTRLINSAKRAATLNNSDDMVASTVYEKGVNQEAQKALVRGLLAGGWTEEGIISSADQKESSLLSARKRLMDAYRAYQSGIKGNASWQQKQRQRAELALAIGGEGYSFDGKNERDEYLRALAALTDKINSQQYIRSLVSPVNGFPATSVSGASAGSSVLSDSKSLQALNFEIVNGTYLNPFISLQDRLEAEARKNPIKLPVRVVEEEESGDEMSSVLKALLKSDNSLYRGINRALGKSAWQRITDSDGGALASRFGAMKLQLSQGVEVPDDVWTNFVNDLNAKLEELNLPPIKLDLETGTVIRMADEVKQLATTWNYVNNAVSSVGSALQTVSELTEDPSYKIAGIVATAIASTALGFAQAAAVDSKYGTVAWIAAAAAGLANLTAMIASIKSVTAEYHADGGFIGGPKGSDVTPMWGTPGELVLNRAQQTNLAAQLAPAGNGGNAQPYVNGEQIWLGLNNYLKRTGRGELVTSRR